MLNWTCRGTHSLYKASHGAREIRWQLTRRYNSPVERISIADRFLELCRGLRFDAQNRREPELRSHFGERIARVDDAIRIG